MGLTDRTANLNVSVKMGLNVIPKLVNVFVAKGGKGSNVTVPAIRSDTDLIAMRHVIVSIVVHVILKLVLFIYFLLSSVDKCS